MVASDGGVPPCMTTEIATVTVTRNLNRPLFDPKDYETITLETALIGETVSTVSAEDSDSRVSPNALDNYHEKLKYLIDSDSDSDSLFNINIYILCEKNKTITLIIICYIHVYVLEIEQRLCSRYRGTTKFKLLL